MYLFAAAAPEAEETKSFFSSFNLSTLFYALITLVICLIVVKIIMTVLRKILSKSTMDSRVAGYIATAVKVVLLVVTLLIVADRLGIPITSLVALLSVLSLAVTLAVQTVLSNVAGGLVILANCLCLSAYAVEGCLAVMVLGLVLLARAVWKKQHGTAVSAHIFNHF